MTTTLAGIKALLKTKISNIEVDEAKIFSDVFDYAEGDFIKFPAAVLSFTGGEGEVLDTHRNERTYNFTLKLYQEQSKEGRTKEEADDIMTKSFDAVIESFDQDPDLSDEVEIIRVVDFVTEFIDKPGTYNYATFNLNCIVIVENYA